MRASARGLHGGNPRSAASARNTAREPGRLQAPVERVKELEVRAECAREQDATYAAHGRRIL
jgi:hypothetical protein